MLETLSEMHSFISLIEQAAALQFNLPAEVGDLTFQLCNMGRELVSVEGLSHCLGQLIDTVLLDEACWDNAEAWISLQRLIAQG